jgi:adenylate cyclase class IV
MQAPIAAHPRRNVELKARCRDVAVARAAAIEVGAAPAGVLEQADTYFRVPHGRLKLRETAGRPAELIQYARPDHPDARGSDYQLVPAPDPAGLKAALAAALGVRGEVRKRRELLLWRNVRIHLDDVAGLGTFLEFEAVLSAADDEPTAREWLAILTDALRVAPADRVSQSYADLLGL